ncbi:MAG: aminoglycoside phosphotransferase family protein [Stackebrandtia sp.]
MHSDQVDITVETVAGLVAAQFPRWRDLPVRALTSHSTVNALFRLGEEIVLRFPLRPGLGSDLREELVREQDNARRAAAHVPLAVPEPLGLGEPGEGYPGWWTAYRWISGEIASGRGIVGDFEGFARDLAGFVRAFHGMDVGGRTWDGLSRGGPLSARDADVRRALADGAGLADAAGLAQAWARCLDAPGNQADVWIHADLMPGNLLVRGGRLAAVIDFGAVCVGDPAVDLMPAWNLLTSGARETYRRALGVDDATWERGRGWAVVQAAIALPYYADTNPVMAESARRTLDAVLE